MFNLSNNTKQNLVGFSLTPGLGLEAVILNASKTEVINYGRKKVDYNFAQRTISNYGQFKNALQELIEEMKIPAKSYAYLVLPNVYFNIMELPKDTDNAGVDMALTAATEDFYIFQKETPVVGWCEIANAMNMNQKRIAYGSFQSSDVEEIKGIFADVNLQLAGIETAYSATLKGLNLTGLIRDAILMDSSWSALLINTNSYTIFQMEGKNLIECNEVPLAIKSFSTEEAYQAIVSNASQLLSNNATSQLFIISQTDDISAGALKNIMQFDREIIAIDTNNKHSRKPLLEVSRALNFTEANSLTLAAIGAADNKSDFDLTLNILNNDPNASMGVYFTADIFGTPTEITKAYVTNAAISACVFLGLIFGGLIGAGAYFKQTFDDKISKLSREIGVLDEKIREAEKVEVKEEEIDMTDIIDEVAADNVAAINFYDSISTDIPKNVWLTKYYNKEGNKLAVRGIAESIIDIYEYYKNLRIVSPQSDIKLTELKVITNPNGESDKEDVGRFIHSLAIDKDVDRLYSFVVSNTEFMVQPKENTPAGGNKPVYDEADILAKPPASALIEAIEQPSSQMKPAQ